MAVGRADLFGRAERRGRQKRSTAAFLARGIGATRAVTPQVSAEAFLRRSPASPRLEGVTVLALRRGPRQVSARPTQPIGRGLTSSDARAIDVFAVDDRAHAQMNGLLNS
jgi:hypothetical protein